MALVAPVLSAPSRLALGHPDADTFNHVWGYWQTFESLRAGQAPWHVAGLVWPNGGTLWFIDLMGALLGLPVAAAAGPVAAYNAVIALNIVFAGLAARWLGRLLGLGQWPAGLVGLIYASCPHVLGQIYDGISETTSSGWLPATLAATLILREDPRPKTGFIAGLLLGFCALASWYYGLFAGLGAALILGWSCLTQTARWRRPLGWRGLLAWAATFLCVAGPATALFSHTLAAPDALVRREETFVALTLIGHNMVDLFSFLAPGRRYSPDLSALFDEALIVVVYQGWVPTLAALLAWRHPGPSTRALAAAALICFVLAQGPYLYVGGDWLTVPGLGALPLPFLALTKVVPGFSSMSHAFRFALPLSLCLALLAGIGLSSARPVWIVAAGLAWLGELVWLSPAVLPLPVADTIAPACNKISSGDPDAFAPLPGPDSGAVLDLPVSLQVLARSRYAGWQIRHGLGIPYGLNDPTPAPLQKNAFAAAIIDLERSTVDTVGPVLPYASLAVGVLELRQQGYQAVIVHEELYPEATRRKVAELLGILLGEPERLGSCSVYPLAAQVAVVR